MSRSPISPSTYPAPAPAQALELEEILSRILLRLADPATLASASLVNRNWYNLVSSSRFLTAFRERQPIRLVGIFSESDGGKDFIPLPLPPELKFVSQFLLEAFHGMKNVQDSYSGYILFKLDDCIAVCHPFEKTLNLLPLPSRFQHIGNSCGEFYLFNNESVVHIDVKAESNLLHVQLSIHCSTWIQSTSTIPLESSVTDEPLCTPALCVNGFVYMLSINGFIVKVNITDCSLSVISLPNGSFEWGFQQICRANDSDILYVHVDGFSIQIWSCMIDKWSHVNTIYLPSFFEQHVEVERRLGSIEWDESKSGWGEFVTIYGMTDGAQHIFMGISGIDDLFLLDIINEDVLKIGSKESNEKGELIGNCISPFVTSWVPLFPRQLAARFSSITISQFKRHQPLDISSIRSCKLNQYQNNLQRTYQVLVAATRDMGLGTDGLPCDLLDNLAFFNELILTTSDSMKKNAVIMGRLTWESIPLASKPISGCLNVILTQPGSSDCGTIENVVFCGSINSALEVLAAAPYCLLIEKVFILGCEHILGESLNGPACDAIHLIDIHSSIESDRFIPPIDFSLFHPWYSSLPVVKGNTRHSFVTFVRVRKSKVESRDSNGKKSVEDDTESDKFEIEDFSFLPKMIFDSHDEYHYLNLVADIISCGSWKSGRTGTWILSKFGCQMRFNLRKNFPLLTTKRVFWDAVVEELLWFISGSTNAKEKATPIWKHNASGEYLHSVGSENREEGDLGPLYGSQWQHYGAKYSNMHADYTGKGFDQLMDVIDKIKNNPDDRPIILSAWNPSDLKKMMLPPCEMFAQFYVESGELSCQMYQGSADMEHDVPFNIAVYSLLTYIIAQACDISPGDFIHVIGDAHVYGTQVQALEEQIQKPPKPFPILEMNPLKKDINSFVASDFKLVGYNPHEGIEMEI